MWAAGSAIVDGKPWPVLGNGRVRVPAGPHVVENGRPQNNIKIVDLNAILRRASVNEKSVTFEYSSDSRAIVRFDRRPERVDLDAEPWSGACLSGTNCVLILPHGSHRVTAN
jgi:hypothetical protein